MEAVATFLTARCVSTFQEVKSFLAVVLTLTNVEPINSIVRAFNNNTNIVNVLSFILVVIIVLTVLFALFVTPSRHPTSTSTRTTPSPQLSQTPRGSNTTTTTASFAAVRNRSRSDSISLDGGLLRAIIGRHSQHRPRRRRYSTQGGTGGASTSLSFFHPLEPPRHRCAGNTHGTTTSLLNGSGGNNNSNNSNNDTTTRSTGATDHHRPPASMTSLDLIRITDLQCAEALLDQLWDDDGFDTNTNGNGNSCSDDTKPSEGIQRRQRLGVGNNDLLHTNAAVASSPSDGPAAQTTTTTTTLTHHSTHRQCSRNALFAFRLRGSAVDTIEYRTITPPSWEANQRQGQLILGPSARSKSPSSSLSRWDLSRIVALHLSPPFTLGGSTTTGVGTGTALLSVRPNQRGARQASSSLSLPSVSTEKQTPSQILQRPVTHVSIQVQHPSEGGVLEIYTKELTSSLDDASSNIKVSNAKDKLVLDAWTMEHTFTSAAAAAQFQLDLIALQVLGPVIHAMYEALSLLHRGSIAFVDSDTTTTEPVLHGYHHTGSVSPATAVTISPSVASARVKVETPPSGVSATDTVPRNKPVNNHGVAWDDIMRCLGCSFPSIRIRLEVMWWLEIHGSWITSTTLSHKERARANSSDLVDPVDERNGPTVTTNDARRSQVASYPSGLAPLYTNKRRLLLGPVDFFRLFVPKLPPTAVPESECSRYRVEHMLRWRKRVAHACILVQWYTRARTVVNRGWSLGMPIRWPDSYWKRRIAFDENLDNMQHDATATNEYYEATVSRDVVCHVRGGLQFRRGSWWQSRSVKPPTAISLYQAYTLVGMHAFQWSRESNDSILHYTKDPVRALSSLRALLDENPELDFFVFVFFPSVLEAAIVQVYVRSFPKGIDPIFDRVIQKFTEGDERVRRRKLEVVTQLGIDTESLSVLGRLLLWWFSLLLRATLRKNAHVPQPTSLNDRTSVPAINVSDCGASFHFGGRLQSDDTLPKNYIATTVHLESRRNYNFVTRIMLSYFECGGLSKYATDFTFVIAGEEENELPERALCSSRIVRSAINAIPMSYGSLNGNSSVADVKHGTHRRSKNSKDSLYWKIFIADPFIVATDSAIKWFQRSFQIKSLRTPNLQYNISMEAGSLDATEWREQACVDRAVKQPLEKAVNEVVRILEGVTIPVRGNQEFNGNYSTELSMHSHSYEVEQIPILRTLSRHDIERYFIASNCCFKVASVRLVESAAWRQRMFPIDTRSCRVELQNGQFFQQGSDYDGNPVFYFRNMCLGPWRRDNDAVVAAVLHRLESRINELSLHDPNVKCTLIVMAGKPYKRKLIPQNSKSEVTQLSASDGKSDPNEKSTAASTFPDRGEDEMVDEASIDAQNDAIDDDIKSAPINNPRICRDEVWNVHTTKAVIERLFDLLLTHYPERLSKALVVVGYGNKKYVRSSLSGILTIASLMPSRRTRDKVRFLTRYRDLQTYVEKSQLVTLVGGTQLVDSKHFECR